MVRPITMAGVGHMPIAICWRQVHVYPVINAVVDFHADACHFSRTLSELIMLAISYFFSTDFLVCYVEQIERAFGHLGAALFIINVLTCVLRQSGHKQVFERYFTSHIIVLGDSLLLHYEHRATKK